jgi:FHS family Na+ dependent glucose MFS transporter 1
MNALHFFFGVGAFISPIIIAQAVLASGDINWAYWSLALLMLPPAAWLLRLKSPQSHASRQSGQPIRVNRLLVALCAFFLFLYVGAEVGFGGWIFTYAIRLGLADETTAAYLTSAFWGSLTLGRLISIPITARLRPRTILLADVLGCLASVGIMIVWPGSLTAVWIGTLGLGFFMATIFPVTISLAGRRMTITGTVTSLFFVGASAGSMTLPWLIGQLFNSIGPRVTMIAIVIDLIIALAIYALLIARSGQPTEGTN